MTCNYSLLLYEQLTQVDYISVPRSQILQINILRVCMSEPWVFFRITFGHTNSHGGG